MTHQEFNFNFHNTAFYGQYWEAKQTEGVVVLVHGMGEHSSRYKHVAKKLTDNHFSVVTFDQFGHGKTKGKRGEEAAEGRRKECQEEPKQKVPLSKLTYLALSCDTTDTYRTSSS